MLTITCNYTEPPWYGPVCQVVWEGGAARLLPIPIGFKEHFVLDLDSKVTREVVVRPANEPEHEVVEVVAEVLESGPGLLQLDIDLGYMASPRIAQWAAQGVYIIARPWPQGGVRFTKHDFTLDFAHGAVTCPHGQTVPMVPGRETRVWRIAS